MCLTEVRIDFSFDSPGPFISCIFCIVALLLVVWFSIRSHVVWVNKEPLFSRRREVSYFLGGPH